MTGKGVGDKLQMNSSGSVRLAQNEQKLDLYLLKGIFCAELAIKIKQSEIMVHVRLFYC